MPRAMIELNSKAGQELVQGRWKSAQGYVPGEPNEGLISQRENSPARLPDYDDSAWEYNDDIDLWISHGFSFVWYRIKVTFPETVGDGHPVNGDRVFFETCVDDYGEIWLDGECNRDRGVPQGFNVPQRVNLSQNAQPGDQHTIAILAANGPFGAPGGAVFVRYANLSFEWRTPEERNSPWMPR